MKYLNKKIKNFINDDLSYVIISILITTLLFILKITGIIKLPYFWIFGPILIILFFLACVGAYLFLIFSSAAHYNNKDLKKNNKI